MCDGCLIRFGWCACVQLMAEHIWLSTVNIGVCVCVCVCARVCLFVCWCDMGMHPFTMYVIFYICIMGFSPV